MWYGTSLDYHTFFDYSQSCGTDEGAALMLNDAPVLEYHSGSILRLFSTSPIPELGAGLRTSRNIILKALFEPDMKWRLVEEFGSDCCEVQEDGRLFLIRNYVDMDNLTMWMLTFGDKYERSDLTALDP